MTATEMVEAALLKTNTKKCELAERLHWTRQKLNGKLKNNTFNGDELIQIMDLLGISIELTEKTSNEPVHQQVKGLGRRIRMMVDRTIYDTDKADAVSNTFYLNGSKEYNDDHFAYELYYTLEGEYIMAEYSTFENCKDRLFVITADEAKEFIQKYGVILDRRNPE